MTYIESLTEITAPNASDVVYVVNDPSGTPLDRKCTIGNLVASSPGKNFLINGGLRLFQRCPYGNSQTLTSSAAYCADRFTAWAEGNTLGAGTITQIKGSLGFDYGHKFVSVTLSGGTPALCMRQRIEACNTKYLANKTISVMCDAYQDTGSTINVSLDTGIPTAEDNYASVNTTSQGTQSLPSGAKTTLKWEGISLGDCSNGLQLVFKALTGDITTKNVVFSNFQLELGNACTAFENLPLSLVLMLCQRYYIKSYDIDVIPGTNTGTNQAAGIASDSGNFYGMGYTALKVTMRTAPSCTPYSSVTGTPLRVRDYSTSSDTVAKTDGAVNDVRTNTEGTLTAGHLYFWHWIADAEL